VNSSENQLLKTFLSFILFSFCLLFCASNYYIPTFIASYNEHSPEGLKLSSIDYFSKLQWLSFEISEKITFGLRLNLIKPILSYSVTKLSKNESIFSTAILILLL